MIDRPADKELSMPIDAIVAESHQNRVDSFHFSSAVRAGNIVVCSGQIGVTADNVPATPEEEFRIAWTEVGHVLEAAGLGFDHIIEYTTYHVDMHDHLGAFLKVRDEFLSEPWPAWTAIGCTELAMPGTRVEIRVMASS